MFKYAALVVMIAGMLLSGGCFSVNVIEKSTSEKPGRKESETPTVTAVRTRTPVQVDGVLDDAVWRQAPAYELQFYHPAGLPERIERKIRLAAAETGTFQLALDDRYLYLAVNFRENDVVDTNTAEQGRLYNNGDLAEIFLYPEAGTPYFEFFVTPTGKRSSFVIKSPSYSRFDHIFAEPLWSGIKAAAMVDGTLNDPGDSDRGWTAELAIPLAEIVARGGTPFDEQHAWRVLVARYNYDYRFAREQALYSFPRLPKADFHLVEYYAPVKIISEP